MRKKILVGVICFSLLVTLIGTHNHAMWAGGKENNDKPKVMQERDLNSLNKELENIRKNKQKKNKEKEYIVWSRDNKKQDEIVNSNMEILEEGRKNKEEKFWVVNVFADKPASLIEETNYIMEENIILHGCSENVFEDEERVLVKHVSEVAVQEDEREWNMQMINADDVEITQPDEKIKIAIIDSGVDYSTDINLVKSINYVDPEMENMLFIDSTGHGTSIAGIIGACNNNEGITGVNPYVEIYSAKVFDENNEGRLSDVIQAIYWAIEQDVDIINMSFGTNCNSELLYKAIQDADNAGILMVAAAGNGSIVEYPAAYNEVMAIGAVDGEGKKCDFSPNAKEIEVVAPGETVFSTGFLGGCTITSGTSMAVPHVVGVASVLWQKDMSMDKEFIRVLLNKATNKCSTEVGYGNGVIDLLYALQIYDECKQSYQAGNLNKDLPKNENIITVFDDISDICIEGSWSKDLHSKMAESGGNNMNLSETTIEQLKEGAKTPDKDTKFAGLSKCPALHGGGSAYAYNIKVNPYYGANYIAAYAYAIRWIEGGINAPIAQTGLRESEREDINNILSKYQNKGTAFLYGIAIHGATDAFSHATYKYNFEQEKWVHLNHNTSDDNYKADEVTNIPARWMAAYEVAKNAVKRYANGYGWSSAAKDFYVLSVKDIFGNTVELYNGNKNGGYRMEKIREYAKKAGLGASYQEFFKKVDIHSSVGKL